MKRACLLVLPLLALCARAEDDPSPARAAIEAEFEEMAKGGEEKRLEAADRLARIDPFPAELLAEDLDSDDLRRRTCALLAFEYAGAASKPAVPAIAALLSARDYALRIGAIGALRACGDAATAAIPELLKAMMSRDPHTASGAAELLLCGMGNAGRDALKAAIAAPDAAASAKAMEELTRASNYYKPGPWALLAEVVAGEKDVWKRLSAAKNAALCRYPAGADAIVPALTKALLDDEDSAVRAACAASLPEPASQNIDLRESAVVALEASAKEDPDEGVRAAAGEALRMLRRGR